MMKRARPLSNAHARLSGLLLVLLLGGCSWFTWLPWVDGKEDEDNDEPAPLVQFDEEVKVQRLWRSSVGDGLGRKYLRLSPVVDENLVFAADGYGTVAAYDRRTGKRDWEVQIHDLDSGFFDWLDFIDRTDPSFVSGGLGFGQGLILVGTTFGEVVALEVADGNELWRANVGSEVVSAPTATRQGVFAQSIDGQLIALSKDTGQLMWTYDNQVPILTLRGTGSPVENDRVVYAGFANGKVGAFRAENGEPLWEHRVMLPEGRSELERLVDVDSTPLLVGSGVYVASYHGRIKSLSQRDGRARWEQEISTYLDLADGYGQIYAIDDEDVVRAFDQQTGEENWVQESFKRRKLTAPIAFSNYVVFGDDEGYLHIIAQRDGRLLGRRKLDGDGLRSNLIVADDTIYALSNSGSLQALEISLN